MFANVLEEICYINEVTNEKTEKNYLLNIVRSVPTTSILAGFYCYEIYLTDSNPKHDILVCIGRKAFAPEEYETEDDRLAALKEIINDALKKNYDRVEKLLNISESI